MLVYQRVVIGVDKPMENLGQASLFIRFSNLSDQLIRLASCGIGATYIGHPKKRLTLW